MFVDTKLGRSRARLRVGHVHLHPKANPFHVNPEPHLCCFSVLRCPSIASRRFVPRTLVYEAPFNQDKQYEQLNPRESPKATVRATDGFALCDQHLQTGCATPSLALLLLDPAPTACLYQKCCLYITVARSTSIHNLTFVALRFFVTR